MPTYGTTFNEGVKYLKINKFDTNGTDKSDYLAQMTSIRINHPDIGVKQYNIATTQVQNDYFIFGLTSPQPFTSSLGDINDYSFLATSASSFTSPDGGGVGTASDIYNKRVTSFGSISGNTLGFMTASLGSYLSGQTPNKFIKVQISGSGTTTAVANGFSIVKNENVEFNDSNYLTAVNSWAGGNFDFTLYLTSSFQILENDQIGFVTTSLIGATTITKFYVSMSLYDATPFNASPSLILYDPDSINFDYNDYNPLLDNAETPQYSTTWMDVDYSQNPLVPINFGLIISGTADRAFVQDSNYSSKAWSNLRYNGSRTNSYRTI